jgi:hypothetical protein
MEAPKAVSMVGSMAENLDGHSAAHLAAASVEWTDVSAAGQMAATTAPGMADMKAASSVEKKVSQSAVEMAASKAVPLAEQTVVCWDDHWAARWAATSADWMVVS